MSQDERELRERCLELAAKADPYGAVKLAREYLAFLKGEDDLSTRERVNAALDAAGVS